MTTTEGLREPQHGFPHVEVAGANPRPWPESPTTLEVDHRRSRPPDGSRRVPDAHVDHRAGRRRGRSPRTRVVRRRVTVAEDRLLGNSATKSALALLTGVAVSVGRLPDLDAPSATSSPSSRAAATTR